MADDRTLVTEIATGLGMLGIRPPVLAGQDFLGDHPPRCLQGVDDASWQRLRTLVHAGSLHRELGVALDNGEAFLRAPGALAGRMPRRIEWTGGRRPPGDEAIPADLRVDHVYLVSCKYLSQLLHNAAPARLLDALLTGSAADPTDWYLRAAPQEYQALYAECRHVALGLPGHVEDLDSEQRARLSAGLQDGWPRRAEERYLELCRAVAAASAERWAGAVGRGLGPQRMLWRLLRLASAPYFVLGTQRHGCVRLRIDTPWDWHHRYRLESLSITPVPAGQPRLRWTAECTERHTDRHLPVGGHVEIRWSHGRFRQPPEAKVYLDTAHELVPGYHPIDEP